MLNIIQSLPGWGYYPSSGAEASSVVQRRVAQQHACMWVWLRAGASSSMASKKLEQHYSVTHILGSHFILDRDRGRCG